jgi:hypothetical protein
MNGHSQQAGSGAACWAVTSRSPTFACCCVFDGSTALYQNKVINKKNNK